MAGDILIRGKHINSVIISPRADFFTERHFNVTPAQCSTVSDHSVASRRRRVASDLLDNVVTSAEKREDGQE